MCIFLECLEMVTGQAQPDWTNNIYGQYIFRNRSLVKEIETVPHILKSSLNYSRAVFMKSFY